MLDRVPGEGLLVCQLDTVSPVNLLIFTALARGIS